MTRRTIKLTATLVEAKHDHVPLCDYWRQPITLEEMIAAHSHTFTSQTTEDSYRIPGHGAPEREVEVTLHDVDVTDFLDVQMVMDELDPHDLLDAIGADDVADWLRDQGFTVIHQSEDE